MIESKLLSLFPFHIAFSKDGKVVGIGPSLAKICGSVSIGQNLSELVELRSPKEASIHDCPEGKFTLMHIREEEILLRGEFIRSETSYFVGSPWILSLEQLKKWGLKFSDFPVHDPISDYLILLQTSQTSLEEARLLTQEIKTARDEAERANMSKSQFLATMSHEIRTPLNVVLGMTELLVDESLSDEQAQLVQMIQSNSNLLRGLIGDLLDLSRIESDQMVLEAHPFDVVQVAEEVVLGLALRVDSERVDVTIETDPSIPDIVIGDSGRLRQVLTNLVGNALKFTESGFVSVKVERIEQGLDNCSLSIGVKDSGIGIPELRQNAIFERFVQASSEHHSQYGGAGLGLHITRQLIELMGGTLSLESKEGVGSTFTALLSLTTTESPQPQVAMRFQGKSAVVISQRPQTRESLAASLRRLGIEVSTIDQVKGAKAADIGFVEPHLWEEAEQSARNTAKVNWSGGEPIQLVSHLGRRREKGLLGCPIRAIDLVRVLNGAFAKEQGTVRADFVRPLLTTKIHSKAQEPKRILLVDDSDANNALLERYLSKEGYICVRAKDGQEAIDAFRVKEISLIFMDLEMPRVTGFEATEAIRAIEKKEKRPRTPIIALTAHALRSYREKAALAGCDDFITKPVDRRLTVETASVWVAQRPRVLVVDDSEDSRVLLERFLLRSNKYHPLLARDGKSALRLALQYSPAAIVLDRQLPDMSGVEVGSALRKNPSTQNTPILFVSGDHSALASDPMILPLSHARLNKPVSRQSFLASIAALIEGSSKASSTPAKDKEVKTPWIDVPRPVDPDIAELLPGYVQRIGEQCAEIASANQGELDWLPNAQRFGHNLKGSAATYGLPFLSSEGSELEMVAKSGDKTRTLSAIEEIANLIKRIRLL